MTFRNDILKYVEKKYKSRPEQLWKRYPDFVIFRHNDNQKWFGLIMTVSKEKLGLSDPEYVDILNVKIDDPFLFDMLIRQNGYFTGYHMNKRSWISILLDGTVPFKDICEWIDTSYMATASKQKKQKLRPAKEWIIPANPKYFDIEHAFDNTDVIDWKQGAGIRTGDTVFMYVAAPVSAILFKCRVTETDIPFQYAEGKLNISSLMKIRLLKRYDPKQFTFERLKAEYAIFAVRGPRGIPYSLSEALKK